MVYCFLLTCWIPGFVLRGVFSKRTPEAQRAWREKMGIVGIVLFLMGLVGFLTFGFTQTVCGTQKLRIPGGQVNNGSLVINGYDYDFSTWRHPAAGTIFNGTTSPLYMDQYMAGGKDASFLFQNVNKNCLNVITPAEGTGINHKGNQMAWYFPCNIHDQNGTSPFAKGMRAAKAATCPRVARRSSASAAGGAPGCAMTAFAWAKRAADKAARANR